MRSCTDGKRETQEQSAGNSKENCIAMTVPCTKTLVGRHLAQSTKVRAGAGAKATGQQLQLPFTTWKPKLGSDTSTQKSLTQIRPAASTELQSTALAAILASATVQT